MNQELISIPNPSNQSLGKHYSTEKVNYISNQHLLFLGEKNKMWFFYVENTMYSFSMISQMKIIRKLQIENGLITFMNKSNQLIIQKKKFIQIWQLDNQNNWMFHKNITIFSENAEVLDQDYDSDLDFEGDESDQCHGLSVNDDLLVVANHDKNIQFREKTADDNWICQQTSQIKWGFIKKLQLNQQGNILIATVDFELKTIIFNRDLKDGKQYRKFNISQIVTFVLQIIKYLPKCTMMNHLYHFGKYPHLLSILISFKLYNCNLQLNKYNIFIEISSIYFILQSNKMIWKNIKYNFNFI